jgi:hypothetical protein
VTLGAPRTECVFGADARNDFGEALYSSFSVIAPYLIVKILASFGAKILILLHLESVGNSRQEKKLQDPMELNLFRIKLKYFIISFG